MQIKRIHIFIVIAILLLLLPFIAMQFSEAVNWTVFDFMAAAVFFAITIALIELVLRQVKKTSYRIGIFIAMGIMLFFIWAEFAVGIM